MTEVEVLNLAELSRSFATRTKGKEVAGLVGDIIAQTKPKTMVVDWDGVRAASPSFIDEFVNGIQEAVHTESCCSCIVFAGDDSGIINLVDAILTRRAFPIRYVARPDNLDGGPVRMLGNPSREPLHTYAIKS